MLDVSAILSLVTLSHQFRPSVEAWIKTLDAEQDFLATCAITELGVVRILPQNAKGNMTVGDAQYFLTQVKEKSLVPFTFLSDDLGADKLPTWVKLPKQTTDGHLAALAKAHGATLATFDTSIPGSFVIPHR